MTERWEEQAWAVKVSEDPRLFESLGPVEQLRVHVVLTKIIDPHCGNSQIVRWAEDALQSEDAEPAEGTLAGKKRKRGDVPRQRGESTGSASLQPPNRFLQPTPRATLARGRPTPGSFVPILPSMGPPSHAGLAGTTDLSGASAAAAGFGFPQQEPLLGPGLGGHPPVGVNPLQYSRILKRRQQRLQWGDLQMRGAPRQGTSSYLSARGRSGAPSGAHSEGKPEGVAQEGKPEGVAQEAGAGGSTSPSGQAGADARPAGLLSRDPGSPTTGHAAYLSSSSKPLLAAVGQVAQGPPKDARLIEVEESSDSD